MQLASSQQAQAARPTPRLPARRGRRARTRTAASLQDQAASLAARATDDAAWRQLEPHFGSQAARDLADRITVALSDGSTAALPGLPSVSDAAAALARRLPAAPAGGEGISRLQVRGGGGSSGGGVSGLPDLRLPSIELPRLPAVEVPSLPPLPKLPEVPLPGAGGGLPAAPELPAASDIAAALADGAAALVAAAKQLPAAVEAQGAALQALLSSEPGAGAQALGLTPHFGTRAAEAALGQLAAALSAALGAPGALPPILQLPTGLVDARLAGAAAAFDPEAVTAAWRAGGAAAAALLPAGAAESLGAAAAAVAAQQAAAAAQLGSAQAALSDLAAAAEALKASGHAGFDFSTLCLVAAGAAAAVAASVPPRGYEASATAGNAGGKKALPPAFAALSADPPLTYEYDPDAVAAYFSRRPVAVATRAAQLAREAAAFGAALAADFATGRVAANEPARARQLRGAIERLGPAYVKVAQALSTRVDLLSPEYFNQIQLLQDRVPPFPCEEAYATMEECFGRPVGEVLARVSPRPVAAASLGQVYRATLAAEYGGGEVAIKVQRPGVLEQVALDLYLMRRLAVALGELPDVTTDWASLIDNWAVRFLHEMDYSREAANATAWAAQMAAAGVDGVSIAEPLPALSDGKVLATRWVDGEKLSESNASDVRALCSTLLNAYLIQLLETGNLHADPHPGNLIRTADGRICVLDFGLMTEVTPEQRIALVEYISHLTTQDWPNVARDLQTLGFIPADAGDPATLGLVAPLGRILSQLSGGGGATKLNIDAVMAELEALGRDYPFSIPPFFALILRAFSVIEGIALRVDPDYSIVQECFPYISRRLLSDDDPRVRKALRDVLYGGRQRLDVDRLVRMADGFSAFTTDGLTDQGPAATTPAAAANTAATRWGQQQQQQAAGAAAAASAAPQQQQQQQQQAGGARQQQQGPALDPAARDALLLVFSEKGAYVQELIAEELVAAVDALSRDAATQLLRAVLASAPAAAAFSRLEALGPLRPLLLPLPTPLELLSRLAPAVRLTEEDEEAIGVVRGILQLAQRLQAAEDASSAGLGGDPSAAPPAAAAAAGVDAVWGAARVAGEITPLLHEIAPGLGRTGELLVRALARRAARRVADAAGDLAAAAGSLTPAGGGGGGDGGFGPGGAAAPAPALSFVSAARGSEEGASVGAAASAAAPAASPAALAAGGLIVGLAAAPLMLALAPLGLLSQMQQQQLRQQGGRGE